MVRHTVTTDLSGRRVLVTGAARGIGAATAKRLHERGARVVLAGIEPNVLARTAARCGHALAVVCDVRDRDQVCSRSRAPRIRC
jgi:NAD(P)-dependent dehydrogenase (short-subunit alcohol dehydrogenase family)